MKDEWTDWRAVYEQSLAERREQLSDRPSLEDVAALAAGELSEARRQHVFRWAAVDADIATMVQDVLRFPEQTSEPSDQDVDDESGEAQDRRWRAFQERLRVEGAAVPTAAPLTLPASRRLRRWLPLAASFLFGVLLMAGGFALRSSSVGGPDPLINLATVQLQPDDSSRSRSGTSVSLPFSSDGLFVTLDSGLSDAVLREAAEPLRIAVEPATSEGFILDGVRAGPGGTFHFTVPRSRLSPGRLQLTLMSADHKTLADFRLDLSIP